MTLSALKISVNMVYYLLTQLMAVSTAACRFTGEGCLGESSTPRPASFLWLATICSSTESAIWKQPEKKNYQFNKENFNAVMILMKSKGNNNLPPPPPHIIGKNYHVLPLSGENQLYLSFAPLERPFPGGSIFQTSGWHLGYRQHSTGRSQIVVAKLACFAQGNKISFRSCILHLQRSAPWPLVADS